MGAFLSRTCLRLVLMPVCLTLLVASARLYGADEPTTMTYICSAPESAIDVRCTYHWEILGTALEETKEKHGPYRMVKTEVMTEKRQTHELGNATCKLTAMYPGTAPKSRKGLVAMHVPTDRNLVGSRVFLVRKDPRDAIRCATKSCKTGSQQETRRNP